LADEPAAPLAGGADVGAEVDLGMCREARDAPTLDAHVEHLQRDEAHVRPAVPVVGLDTRRDRASDQGFRSLEGEEDDVRPAGGEKGTRRHLWSRLGSLLIWRPDTEGSMTSPATPEARMRIAKLIHGALTAGVVLFLLVTAWVHRVTPPAPVLVSGPLLPYVGLGVLGAAMLGLRFVPWPDA